MFLKKISASIFDFLDLVRYWVWRPIVQTNIIAALVLFVFIGNIAHHLSEFIIFIVYMHAAFSFGFLVNGYADLSVDKMAGKNYLDSVSKKYIFVLLSIFFLILISLPFYFNNVGITVSVALGIFLGVFYSLKPLRFKECGFFGIIASTVSQRLPFILFFFIMPDYFVLNTYIFGWLILDGILIELGHQIDDYNNDILTKTNTFLVSIGKHKAKITLYIFSIALVLYMLFPLALASLNVALLCMILFIFSQTTLREAQRQIHNMQLTDN